MVFTCLNVVFAGRICFGRRLWVCGAETWPSLCWLVGIVDVPGLSPSATARCVVALRRIPRIQKCWGAFAKALILLCDSPVAANGCW